MPESSSPSISPSPSPSPIPTFFDTIPTSEYAIDFSHQDAQHLIHAWLFNAGNGSIVVDLVTGINSNLSGSYSWDAGGGVSFNGGKLTTPTLTVITGGLTYIIGFKQTTSSGWASFLYPAATYSRGFFIINGATDPTWSWYNCVRTGAWKDGTPIVGQFSITLNAETQVAFKTSTTFESAAYDIASNRDSDSFYGKIAFVYIYDSSADIASIAPRLANDPYAMFIPSSVSSSVSPSPSLSPSSSPSLLPSESPSISPSISKSPSSSLSRSPSSSKSPSSSPSPTPGEFVPTSEVYLFEDFEKGPPFSDPLQTTNDLYTPPFSSIYQILFNNFGQVYAGIGKDNTFGLGANYDEDEWFWVMFQPCQLAPNTFGVLTPLADAGKGRIQFDIKFYDDTWSYPGGFESTLFDISRGCYDATYGLNLRLANDETGGPLTWYLCYSYGNGTPNTHPIYTYDTWNAPLVSSPWNYADLVDGQFHRVEVTWQAGTVTDIVFNPPPINPHMTCTIQSDGWIRLKVDGVVVLEAIDIPLILNEDGTWSDSVGEYYTGYDANPSIYAASVAAVNRFTGVALGDAWLCPGIYDNLIVGIPIPSITWVDIADFIEHEFDATSFPGGSAKVSLELWSAEAGVTMKVRLYDEDAGIVVGESNEVISTTPVGVLFPVQFPATTGTYKLQVTADIPGVDLFVFGAGLIL